MVTNISQKKVQTRKPHKCFACGREFPKGTTMVSSTNVFDNRIYTLYTCETCDTLISKHSKWLLDEQENYYPEGCVAELLGYRNDWNCKTPEELLIYLNEKIL
jgi:DNA-directed RNA polymerase subunit RPC12/RpoP